MTHPRYQRGSMLLVVVFIATAIAILATISSGRVVTETRAQKVLEDETRAFNEAFSQLHMALNVVNSSPYNALNQNLVIRNALADAGLRETLPSIYLHCGGYALDNELLLLQASCLSGLRRLI